MLLWELKGKDEIVKRQNKDGLDKNVRFHVYMSQEDKRGDGEMRREVKEKREEKRMPREKKGQNVSGEEKRKKRREKEEPKPEI